MLHRVEWGRETVLRENVVLDFIKLNFHFRAHIFGILCNTGFGFSFYFFQCSSSPARLWKSAVYCSHGQ